MYTRPVLPTMSDVAASHLVSGYICCLPHQQLAGNVEHSDKHLLLLRGTAQGSHHLLLQLICAYNPTNSLPTTDSLKMCNRVIIIFPWYLELH
jgi:hypothetical protein